MEIQEVKVKTVDSQILIDCLNVKLEENQKLHIDQFCVYEDKFGIDIDCCFWDLITIVQNNKPTLAIPLDCRIKKYNENGGYSIRMDQPDFETFISLEDYIKLAREINLIDFIRFNYNPRIISNQRLLMKYINN